MISPETFYTQRKEQLRKELSQLIRKKNFLGWLRLLSLAAGGIAAWQLWTAGFAIVLAVIILFLALFLYILSKDLNNNNAIENSNRLVQINDTELNVLQHHYTQLPDGNNHKPEEHNYANDLDIFGRASLFQYINRTTSEQGSRLLADWLLHPALPESVLARQEAVKELAAQPQWRQQLQSYGQAEPVKLIMQQKISSWIQEPDRFINKSSWRVMRFLLPVFSCTALTLHITGFINAGVFYPVVIFFLIASMIISKQVMPAYHQLNKIAPQLGSLSGATNWIEQSNFQTALLSAIKNKYKSQTHPSSYSIKKLKKILDMLDVRLNPLVFIPLNTFLFWDLQQVFALEKWKTDNKSNILHWFEGLAETEFLSSLAGLSFNHPAWAFPLLTNEAGVFNAADLGHPLIPAEKMITSSFTTSGMAQLNLITGSNMAGKSTFLRSVGVNVVLAMAGAPVCARSLTLSPMKVMSSMRISDNLEESTSTFYAELKKLKEIIEAVNKKENVFLLLDEILRGTNSADRHAGSKALIKQLIHHSGAGLIATHDLELAKLAEEFPGNIHNYHFDVQVSGNELYFDYKLKRGVCRSMNASLLMKKIGIEL